MVVPMADPPFLRQKVAKWHASGLPAAFQDLNSVLNRCFFAPEEVAERGLWCAVCCRQGKEKISRLKHVPLLSRFTKPRPEIYKNRLNVCRNSGAEL
eukprot:1146078-Pelagomonas_calceolata.AAC.7